MSMKVKTISFIIVFELASSSRSLCLNNAFIRLNSIMVILNAPTSASITAGNSNIPCGSIPTANCSGVTRVYVKPITIPLRITARTDIVENKNPPSIMIMFALILLRNRYCASSSTVGFGGTLNIISLSSSMTYALMTPLNMKPKSEEKISSNVAMIISVLFLEKYSLMYVLLKIEGTIDVMVLTLQNSN